MRRGGRIMVERAVAALAAGAVLRVFRHPEKPAAGYLDGEPGFLGFVSSAELDRLLRDSRLRMAGGRGVWDHLVEARHMERHRHELLKAAGGGRGVGAPRTAEGDSA